MKCEGWCLPVLIYVVLVVISLILSLTTDFTGASNDDAYTARMGIFVFHIFWAIFWVWVLYTLCVNCYYGTAWIILLLPFIIGLFVLAVSTAVIIAYVIGDTVKKGYQTM